MTATSVVAPQRAVKDLMRLGWAVAEWRGRVCYGPDDPGQLFAALLTRKAHGLPLAEERSSTERRIEVEDVVATLATELHLDFVVSPPPGQPATATATATATQRLQALAKAVYLSYEPVLAGPHHRAVGAFTEAMYRWDSTIQDELATGDFGETSAYQLGRGLAETSWTLDPAAEIGSWNSWEHLLGVERCVALNQLLDRMSKALDGDAVTAIKGSIAEWHRQVDDPGWRTGAVDLDQAPVYLRRQIDIWRDLILIGTPPKVFEPPASALAQIRSTWTTVKVLWPQIALAGFGILLLATGVFLFAKYGGATWAAPAVSALGVFGVSGSSISSREKRAANNLVARIADGAAADELVLGVTRLPPRSRPLVDAPNKWTAPPGASARPVTLDDARRVDHPTGAAPAAAAKVAGEGGGRIP